VTSYVLVQARPMVDLIELIIHWPIDCFTSSLLSHSHTCLGEFAQFPPPPDVNLVVCHPFATPCSIPRHSGAPQIYIQFTTGQASLGRARLNPIGLTSSGPACRLQAQPRAGWADCNHWRNPGMWIGWVVGYEDSCYLQCL
jgi:hypothetical protein